MATKPKFSWMHGVIIGVFILDITIVILHLTLGQQYNLFNIDLERNLPVWYQVFKLIIISSIVAATIALLHHTKRLDRATKWLLWPFWFGFAYLGLDELGEIHEQVGDAIKHSDGWLGRYGDFLGNLGFTSALWLAALFPVIIAVLIYLGYLARWFYRQKTGLLYLLIIAIICFALVPVVEFWNTSETSYSYTFTQRNLLVTLEESLELIGVSFFLTFNLLLYRFYANIKPTRKSK